MAKSLLDELIERFDEQPPTAKREITQRIEQAKLQDGLLWAPNPGPQTEAYFSEADILLYGGQAGGGKTHLELGWCANEAQAGIIFRRELTQTDGLEAEGKKILTGWNGQDHEWTFRRGDTVCTVKLAGMRDADSWEDHAGRERDTMCFDEAGEFLEKQVSSLLAWLRSESGRRTRVILASNPPRTADGLWMLEWFAPWLDDAFPNPAAPGELRWAVYVSNTSGGGRTIWVEGPGEYTVDGEQYTAMSRTFIPASLEDNPYRNNPQYRAKLQSLPEPLRSQLLHGDFKAGLSDSANQAIPTAWVRAAMDRWTKNPPDGIPMCAIGVDPTGGGTDDLCMAPRHDSWFAPLIKVPAKDVPQDRLGSHMAGIVVKERRDGAIPIIDLGGGYGSSLYERLQENDIECIGYKGAEGTTRRSKDRKFGFTNVRTAAYWGFREALDPDQPGGSTIALPPDKRLLAGLCAPTFEITSKGIKLEPKSKREGGVKGVVERLGWSPNEADSVVMSWWAGPRMATNALEWIEKRQTNQGRGMRGMQPKVVVAYQSRRRR